MLPWEKSSWYAREGGNVLKLIYLSMNFYILSRLKHVSIFLQLEDYKLIQNGQEQHIDISLVIAP